MTTILEQVCIHMYWRNSSLGELHMRMRIDILEEHTFLDSKFQAVFP
jgi:hypothetical protein